MSWFATHFISAFLLPPLSILLLGLFGLLLYRRRPRRATWLISLSFGLLYIFSTPFFAERLLSLLERQTPLVKDENAQAIVVLGAGIYIRAPEYGGGTVNGLALERLRYAAKLHRETALPILVTGGKTEGTAESLLMKHTLEEDFRAPVKWTESASRNTRENAIFSSTILRQAGITSIYLVTHAWHMPRALAEFQHTGLHVIPAPTRFTTRSRTTILDFLPDARALLKSYYATHEGLGWIWYRLSE